MTKPTILLFLLISPFYLLGSPYACQSFGLEDTDVQFNLIGLNHDDHEDQATQSENAIEFLRGQEIKCWVGVEVPVVVYPQGGVAPSLPHNIESDIIALGNSNFITKDLENRGVALLVRAYFDQRQRGALLPWDILLLKQADQLYSSAEITGKTLFDHFEQQIKGLADLPDKPNVQKEYQKSKEQYAHLATTYAGLSSKSLAEIYDDSLTRGYYQDLYQQVESLSNLIFELAVIKQMVRAQSEGLVTTVLVGKSHMLKIKQLLNTSERTDDKRCTMVQSKPLRYQSGNGQAPLSLDELKLSFVS